MSDGRTQILYIAPWVDLGGSDKGTIDWFKHVDRERWAPSLITTQPSPNRWLHHLEPFAEEVWDLPDLMPGGSFPEFILGFIESRGVRVVHVMNSRLGFDLLPDVTCLAEPPAVVVQMHAEEPDQTGYVRYVARRYCNLVDAFSVTSEHLKRTIAGYDVPPSRIEVIHSGVDGEEEFNPERVEPFPLADDGAARILWPGRLVEQKDPLLTLDVLARARERGGEFVLDLVGDGPMLETVRARAEGLGVADAIAWHPPSQEMARWYRSADLLLMTSVYEGVPYVIYESLAMGVPVVAPALPGNVEFMDADSGVLIDPRDDADRYAEAIVELLSDEGRRRELGERSRRRMLSDFSLADMGRRHDELYERLLERRPSAASPPVPAAAPAPPARIELPRDRPREPTVGVVVPCFRHGIFVEECIESIRAQTLAPAQIVVVDDGSDDSETIAAMERLEAAPDLTVLRLPVNSGPSTARNLALERIEASYMLPIDADDKLLLDALERMVAQLESAPPQIGFVYPHPQHFGNRSDYMQLPAYNLWLLTEENYCPAPCLFDRRLFGPDGVSYPEEIVLGHEDWDLLLQLAERGVHGVPADGPTFLYRRQGFSRINAAEYGPHSFDETIERRHPALYEDRDAIKAEWAPALSIVLFDEGGGEGWEDVDRSGLELQSCRDFEAVEAKGDLRGAIRKARGRWLCLLTPPAAGVLAIPSFVEHLLYGFRSHEGVSGIVLADPAGPARHALSQLDDRQRLEARPLGVAFERPWATLLPPVELASEESLLVDLAIYLQSHGLVQWRAAPGGGEGPAAARSALPAGRPRLLDVNHDRSGDRSEVAMRDAVGSQPPRLPELRSQALRRWDRSKPWMPPLTKLLCRHVSTEHGGRFVSNESQPPPGYELEFVLGAVRFHAAPGSKRLVATNLEFELSDEENDVPGGARGLGYVERQPLPMFERLELRTMPDSDRQVLVAGRGDPLNTVAEPVATLGWLEAHPILPRHDLLHVGPWGIVALRRQIERAGLEHRYVADPPGGRADGLTLGFLRDWPGDGYIPLWLRADGRLASDLVRPEPAVPGPREIGRWIAGPLKEASPGHARASAGAVRERLRGFHLRRRNEPSRADEVALGWLRRDGMPGWSALLSATHPVTGDQLVTLHEQEAADAGYVIDGVLGHVLDTAIYHPG